MLPSSNQQHPTSLPYYFSASVPIWDYYDVFLSFRGKDTRKNFTDHIYTALTRQGLKVFRDEENLERGREISQEILKAIAKSRFAIIIFSENYASSAWCLDELVEIIECTKKTGLIAYPIFYNVDPSNVRYLEDRFATAFAVHERNLERNLCKVQKWREALYCASNLAGWDSRGRHESKIIEEIVEEVFSKLNQAQAQAQAQALLHAVDQSVSYVNFVGIHGLVNTTIPKAVYNHSDQGWIQEYDQGRIQEYDQGRIQEYERGLMKEMYKVKLKDVSNQFVSLIISKVATALMQFGEVIK